MLGKAHELGRPIDCQGTGEPAHHERSEREAGSGGTLGQCASGQHHAEKHQEPDYGDREPSQIWAAEECGISKNLTGCRYGKNSNGTRRERAAGWESGASWVRSVPKRSRHAFRFMPPRHPRGRRGNRRIGRTRGQAPRECSHPVRPSRVV